MRKKNIFINLCSILCLGLMTFSAIAFANSKSNRVVGVNEYYSITINAEDITINTSLNDGSCLVYTDQLGNPITFNYQNIKFEQDGSNKYIVFSGDSYFSNDRNSQIRRLEYVTVYGDGSTLGYDYGWNVKINSIQFTGEERQCYANGDDISFNNEQPNYFAFFHYESEPDAKISKIVFTYSRDCTPGEKPISVLLDYIELLGETTSLNRGQAFSFGGNVIAHYTDGSTRDVTPYATFDGYDMSVSGTYSVTASYIDGSIIKTATYSLTVNKVWSAIWSGTKDIYIDRRNQTTNISGMGTIVSGAVHSSTQLRISFSVSYVNDITDWPTDSDSWICGIYWAGENRATSFGSSPRTITINSWGSNILNVRATASTTAVGSNYWAGFKIATSSNGNITASTTWETKGGKIKVGIKLTKIEEFY